MRLKRAACSRPSLLIVYGLMQHPLRSTVDDHLYSFRRYAGARCFYVNAMLRPVPAWIARGPHDAVIFHTSLLSALRWGDEPMAELLLARARAAAGAAPLRIALPQDEFLNTDLLCRFIRECDVHVVCSVSPPTEWPKIYDSVDRDRVRIEHVLTGYLEESTLRRIARILARSGGRTVDVGYRAGAERPYLGRHGLLKTAIADPAAAHARARGLSTDIGLGPADVLVGDDWFRALARWRWTLGVEGGASVLDRDGSVRRRTEEYMAAHPSATFEEVEAACFPGLDGELALFALSPRHLEACATRTGQILVEGEYDGVLEAGRHYLPLRPDLSNLREVLEQAGDERTRSELVAAAHRDVVESGRYTYRAFVDRVMQLVNAPRATGSSAGTAVRSVLAWALDRLSWGQVAYRLRWHRRVATVWRAIASFAAVIRRLSRVGRTNPPG
jgi:hypothetical protein